MTKKVKKILKLVLKYLLPAFLGWLEGDSHVVVDSLSELVSLFI